MRKLLVTLPLTKIIIIVTMLVSLFLHTYQAGKPCLNEDEAAQGYNTYSVLQTGYDEYGQIPIRYLSFGENKLPLTGMLSTPFISILGLNELSVRLPVLILGILFPAFFFGATYSLTKSKRAALIACALAGTNVWLGTMSRHQHEAVVLATIVLIYISTLFNNLPKLSKRNIVTLGILSFMGLYTYHSAKVIIPFLIVSTLILIFNKQRQLFKLSIIIFVVAICLFGLTEFIQPTNRVANLSYFTSPVFAYEIQEGRKLGGSPLFYNKVVYGGYTGLRKFIGYLSPRFLLSQSDTNFRYGYPSVHLLTYVEYIFLIIGLSIMWIRKLPYRLFLTLLIGFSIFPATFALSTDSSTRSFLLTIPVLIIASIGYSDIISIASKYRNFFIRSIICLILLIFVSIHTIQIFQSWHNYFAVYLSDNKTSWQCGAKEMSDYVWTNYGRFDHFIITSANGQPYIYLLFFKPYPPRSYQQIATTKPYNEYGFWEQTGFDKFTFRKPNKIDDTPKSAFILTPEEVRLGNLDISRLIPLTSCGSLRYYVYETK